VLLLLPLLQLGGLGWEGYWKNSWNKFDLLLLISSVVDMIVAIAMGETPGAAAPALDTGWQL
jgi:hypothetical protein